MSEQTLTSQSAEETIQFGQQLGAKLLPNTIVCLSGDLGSGKTTFSKGLVEGVTKQKDLSVESPTYTYLNIYPPSLQGLPVYHFDLYRLKTQEDFLGMGFEDFLDAGGICCIEWSEKIKEILPIDVHTIEFQTKNPTTRAITIKCP